MTWDVDDADHVALAWALTPMGFACSLLLLSLVVAAYWCAYANERECERQHCASGLSPKLMDGECLCVAKATDG